MYIFIDKFGGIIPRQPEHSLDISSATIAHNVRLNHNRIEAWREPSVIGSAPNAKSFYMHGCCPILFDKNVEVAMLTPDYDRLFVTGNTEYPQVLIIDGNCKTTYYRLGVPAPAAPAIASAQELCTRASDARCYTYTYINAWGEESAPAPVSNIITTDDGIRVHVRLPGVVPNDYNITAINIYRTVTGFREQNVQQQSITTTFLYVDSVPVNTTVYHDLIPMVDLGAALETEKVQPPPKGLKNLCVLDDEARLCGSKDNKIYFSEAYQPYNWPIKYELTLDEEIIHIGVYHGQLFATTNSSPYVISPANCRTGVDASVRRYGWTLPDIGCIYPHSNIVTPYGFIFTSTNGLVLLKADGLYGLLTAKWFSTEDWRELLPNTARLGFWQNYLFVITDRASFILNIDPALYGELAGGELVTISDKPIDLFTTNTGELLLLEDGKIKAWNAGKQYRPYVWESRELVGQDGIKSNITFIPKRDDARGVSWSPVSAKVHTKSTQFSLISPLQNPAYTQSVVGEDWFRLPRVGRNLWYKVRLEGIQPVDFVALGTSNFTLNQGK